MAHDKNDSALVRTLNSDDRNRHAKVKAKVKVEAYTPEMPLNDKQAAAAIKRLKKKANKTAK